MIDIDEHIPPCECGGKRKVITVVKKDHSWIAKCKKCKEQFIITSHGIKNNQGIRRSSGKKRKAS